MEETITQEVVTNAEQIIQETKPVEQRKDRIKQSRAQQRMMKQALTPKTTPKISIFRRILNGLIRSFQPQNRRWPL